MSQLRDFYNELLTENKVLKEINEVKRIFINNQAHIDKFVDDIIEKGEAQGLSELNSQSVKEIAKRAVLNKTVFLGSNIAPDAFVISVVNTYNDRIKDRENAPKVVNAPEAPKKNVVRDFDDKHPYARAVLSKNVNPSEQELMMRDKLKSLKQQANRLVLNRQRGESVED